MNLPICKNCGEMPMIYTTKQNKHYIRCDCGRCTPATETTLDARIAWDELNTPRSIQAQHTMKPALNLRRGEVYWCEVPPRYNNNGDICSVQYGTKPYIVYTRGSLLAHSNAPLMIPCSTSNRKYASEFHPQVATKDKISLALCEQITPMPKDYIQQYMCTLSEADMKLVDKGMQYVLDIEADTQDAYRTMLKELCSECSDLINKYKEQEE